MIGARHFQCVIALAEALNFTVAAQRLHIAQPALSQTIQQIENELGVRLFERHTRKVALTAAGKVLYREARTTLEHIERAARMTQTAAKGEAGILSIGFTISTMMGELPARINSFRNQYSNVHVLLRELPPRALVDALRTGALDVGCLDGDVIDELLESKPLASVPVVVALNRRHRLTRVSSLRLAMLAKETFILPSPDSQHSLYNIFLQACRKAGFEPVDPYFVDTLPAGIGMVSANIGVTLQHRQKMIKCRDVVFPPLTTPELRLKWSLVWRKEDLSPLAAKFISIS